MAAARPQPAASAARPPGRRCHRGAGRPAPRDSPGVEPVHDVPQAGQRAGRERSRGESHHADLDAEPSLHIHPGDLVRHGGLAGRGPGGSGPGGNGLRAGILGTARRERRQALWPAERAPGPQDRDQLDDLSGQRIPGQMAGPAEVAQSLCRGPGRDDARVGVQGLPDHAGSAALEMPAVGRRPQVPDSRHPCITHCTASSARSRPPAWLFPSTCLRQGGALVQTCASCGQSAARRVLRRAPLGHVLPTAHDMAREYRVLTALHGTAIPVPAPVAFCPDPEVIGAPFYLMEYVDGLVLRTREDGDQVTEDQARQLSERLAGMLAAIHGVDIAAVGLTDFGRPAGYLARQLARWQRQWELSATREMPGYSGLVERLTAGLPDSAHAALVHGDFRIDNMLVVLGDQPEIAAVVDWEMCTLGDPLADLGLTLMYWADPADEEWRSIGVGAGVTARPVVFSRAQLARRYAELTGLDISGIGYYMAFGCFKLAVVLEGIHARYLQHKTVGEGFDREGQVVPLLIARAHELLDSDPLASR